MKTRHIVVGIDGSRASRNALRWAVGEARLRGAVVDAVHVWHYPRLAYAGMMAAPAVTLVDLEAGARALLDSQVDSVLAEVQDTPPVTRVILEGRAGDRLVEYASAADLLVLGNSGRHGIPLDVLGSVAHHCSIHATCPVVVFRDTTRRAA